MIKDDEKRLFHALITEKDRHHRNEILDNTGIPEKRLSFILLKWSGRDIWSYGTHEFGGWFEEDGFNNPKNLPWLLEIIGNPQHPATSLLPSFSARLGMLIKYGPEYRQRIVGIITGFHSPSLKHPGYVSVDMEIFDPDLFTALTNPTLPSVEFH